MFVDQCHLENKAYVLHQKHNKVTEMEKGLLGNTQATNIVSGSAAADSKYVKNVYISVVLKLTESVNYLHQM